MGNPKSHLREVQRRQLLKKHQLDLFHCGVNDASMKCDMLSMMYPLFSLKKKPDLEVKEVVIGNKVLRIQPGPAGMPTIWDKDILLYCAAQITDALNHGEGVGRTVRMDSYDVLRATRRGTGGNNYSMLVSAAMRLKGTVYTLEEQHPREGVRREWKTIGGFIDDVKIIEYDGRKRAVIIDITLSERFFMALLEHDVLTFTPDYFGLTGGLERRLYEIARKFCGEQDSWSVSLVKLQQRVGSSATLRKFRGVIKAVADNSSIPGYEVAYEPGKQKTEGGKVTFYQERCTQNI